MLNFVRYDVGPVAVVRVNVIVKYKDRFFKGWGGGEI